MVISGTVRQVRLKPERADHHPTLPARMWTSAAGLAELVISCRRAQPLRAGKAAKARTLSETDFDFRGGDARRLDGLLAQTRIGEPGFSPSVEHQPLAAPGRRAPELPGCDHQIH